MSAEVALDDLFVEFHAQNPEIYAELVELARRWQERGHRRVGIATLYEVLRWQRALSDVGDDHFKLNNSYRSRYARKLMDDHPEFRGLFQLRELRT